MNIFFAGSIRGGRAHQPEYASIVKALEEYGEVHSQHVQDETLSHFGETRLPANEILEREQAALEKCDVVVAEVTTPSLGVGYLIARASALNKKIIALYAGDDTLKLSAIIKGDQNVEVQTYKTDQDVGTILNEEFGTRMQ
jgi:hypothetical protein